MPRVRGAVTLIEVIIVVLILGFLLFMGMAYYANVQERARSAEARAVLAQIRIAEEAYKLENNAYLTINDDADFTTLAIPGISTSCEGNHYFRYSLAVAGNTFVATADRCQASGKPPQGKNAYQVTLNDAGALTLPAGF